jgi:hypothetical protein
MKDLEILLQQNNIVHKAAVVEAGHFYANNPITTEELQGLTIGIQATQKLKDMGLVVIPCTLVDNYNAPDIYSQQNLSQLKNDGYSTDWVFWEKEVVADAEELLGKLSDGNKIKQKKGKTYLKEGFSLLVDDTGKYSCSLLDAGLYVNKFFLSGGICVTVLPETFKPQQETTKKILKAAAYNIPIMNIYYAQDSKKVSLDFSY